MLTIKNLHQGKYGVIAVPPAGSGWQQTSTIEGTKVIDAWVKNNEPPYFAEFGPPGPHVAIGFVKPFIDSTRLTGGATISGKIVNNHLSRPPDYAFYNGATFEHTTPWVGLNDAGGAPGVSRGIYAQKVNPDDGSFSIFNVPPGNYQLVVWDDALDIVFASYQVTVNANLWCNALSSCALGEVAVFQWFTRTHHYVFNDTNGNGFRDPGEGGLLEQNVNIRWRDGTVNQAAPTDLTGFVPFDEVFPFFAWQVAEVDFARFKPTGVTVTVDHGGPIPTNGVAATRSFDGQLNPQAQTCTAFDLLLDDPACPDGSLGAPRVNPQGGGVYSRTYTGPILTQAFQGFLGQTSVFEWGKQPYGPTENGGVSGIVYYDTTRAEDDPRDNFAEPWSPGIPGVTVKLWTATAAGKPDVHVATVTTDSWDDSVPEGCQGDKFTFTWPPSGSFPTDCYDGLRNFNQVRPGVFDGGYAFTECQVSGGKCVADTGGAKSPLPAGQYVVEVVPPKGPSGQRTYEVVKEEDKNVDFGDDWDPHPPALVFPPCVGDRAALYPLKSAVPAELDLFAGVAAAFAGQVRPLCNMKLVSLSNGSNAAADFFLFTEVPISGHISGMILDDASNEFDPNSPNFGEKYSPPWLPVSIRDWTGREVGRTYADKFGRFNALVPSSYTANRPSPSGISPNVVTTCMNAKGDPWHNPRYSEFCYNFQYMPGATTYLDTPVVPVAAFAGPNQQQLDCEFPNGTPRIKSVEVANGGGFGPLVTASGQTITITSMGSVTVPNPAYCPGPPITTADACPLPYNNIPNITRDYGFGPDTQGRQVTIGGVPLTIVSWAASVIQATVPAGVTTGQLVVTRADNQKSTIMGLTVQVGTGGGTVRRVGVGQTYTKIQDAIDAATNGDLILVGPGTYNEMVIMWKPVRLQGYGEGSTFINAVNLPTEKLQAWRTKVQSLVAGNVISLVPGQENAAPVNFEPVLFFNEEGAGVAVFGRNNSNFRNNPSRIDGFAITGADNGGGVVVNGFAENLQISNNRVSGNTGNLGGGVRVGHPQLISEQGGLSYSDAQNDGVRIQNNHIALNGGLGGVGGGVAICTGADNYRVTGNFICGNYSMGDGAGIGHLGVSTGGLIEGNTILFNENFNQGIGVHGGGILIAGQAPLAGQAQSPGSGSVTINRNLLQGNLAGAGDGGGIRLSRVNGADVAQNRNQPARWHQVDLFNNMIVNNVAGMAGGGISIHDAVRVNILHNTIANNDSTATAGAAFVPGNPNRSNPQPAGIVAYGHTPALASIGAGVVGTFSNPRLEDNIVWHNRSFYFRVWQQVGQDLYQLVPGNWPIGSTWPPLGTPPYYFHDFGVVGAGAARLSPTYSLLSEAANSNTTGYNPAITNILTVAPGLVAPYQNGHAGVTIGQPEATAGITPPPAFDEGGNFIRVRFGPLTINPANSPVNGNYHIQLGSLAIDTGVNRNALFPLLLFDFDRQLRPAGANVDIGADEYYLLP